MTNTTIRPTRLTDTNATVKYDNFDAIQQWFLGGDTAAAADATGVNDDARFGLDVVNSGSGGQSLRTRSGDGTASYTNANNGNLFTGGISVSGAASFTGGAATFASNVTIGGALGVTGATTLRSTLGVSGVATFVTGASVGGALTVTGISTFVSNVSMVQGLTVSQSATIVGNATVGGSVLATGVATFLTGVTVGGTLGVTGTASFVSNVTMTQGLVVLQSATVGGNLLVTGSGAFGQAVTVSTGGVSVTGSSVFSSGISVTTGGVSITAGGIQVLANGITITGASSFSTTVTVNGEAIAKTPQMAACSGDLTLSTTATDITGCSVSLGVGEWVVTGDFFFKTVGSDTGVNLFGILTTTGGTATVANSGSLAVLNTPTTGLNVVVSKTWYVQVTSATTARLQGRKSGGGGTSVAGQTHTTITAHYLGKP